LRNGLEFFNTAVRKFEFSWNGMLQGDTANKETSNTSHSKQTKHYTKWILDKYAKNQGTLLD
jgi:hypothetical protein